MAVPTQFAYRTLKEIGIVDAAPVYAALPGFEKPQGATRCSIYSPCGRYFAYASNEGVTCVETSTGYVVSKLEIPHVYELGFSPKGSYLITWERPSKDENGDAVKNLKVWRSKEDESLEEVQSGKKVVGQFVQRNQTGWNLQYTPDEKYCARTVTNEVQFFESHDLRTVWNKLRAEGVADFALSPGQNNSIAIFVPERKGMPAAVKVFNVPQFTTPVSQKTFFKGDKVQLKWNALGTTLIVLAQTEVDKTGKSYYGETNLYVLSANGGFDSRITLDKEGPIHDVTWSPNSKEFGVIYGFMPTKTTIFNQRAVATHSFPLGPRNTILFSPNGRFVLVAGFGNLAGQMDIYDLEKDYRKICTIEGGNPSVCEWSPDSRYILTATTSPRLRVDNGIRIWHVGGGIMYNEDMVELYNVTWRPQSLDQFPAGDVLNPVPVPHKSALAYLGTVKAPSKPAGAYRPPGARGMSTPLHFKREDEGGAAHSVSNGTSLVGSNGFGHRGGAAAFGGRRAVPGAEPVAEAAKPEEDESNLSKAALKNKKKREAKKAKDAEAKANGGAAPAGEARPSPAARNVSQQNSNGRNGSPASLRGGGGRGMVQDVRLEGQTQSKASSSTPKKSSVVEKVEAPAQVEDTNSPAAKKLRGLQKKIRAIEDLEMRLAGGERLEDTQMKKIGTKEGVLRELEGLEN